MIGFEEYQTYDALGLAELVRKGVVSPDELLDEALALVEERNPIVNAVILQFYDKAREAITRGLPDGPFRGVPFLLKDINTSYAGVPTTNGCTFFADNVPDFDSEIVARYKRAGLVLFAKSAAPEFGITTSTESKMYGITRNPWNLEHTAGGSSGGTAAAIASGIVPASDGSDGGGSIRIPASCCGLVGLKPTRGRIPAGPDKGESWSGMSTSGSLTRTVRDTAALLDISSGNVHGDPYYAPPLKRPLLAEVGADPGKLRVVFQTESFNGTETHPDCIKAVHEAAKACEELGHHVEESVLSIDAKELGRAVRRIVAGSMRSALDARAKILERELTRDDVEAITYAIYENGNRYTAGDYVWAIRVLHTTGRQVAAFFDKCDVLLTPTMAAPPVKVDGVLRLSHPEIQEFNTALGQSVGYTQLFNVSGNPAISLPLHVNGDGLPIGVQIAAPFGDEATLVRLSSQLEDACPWKDTLPVAITAEN